MTKITALDVNHHLNLKVDITRVTGECRDEQTIPVALSEFINAAVEYPIVFVKNVDTGQFLPVVLCGFESGENLYWKPRGWDADYIPLNVRRQPFFLGNDGMTNTIDKQIICVDLDSACFSDKGISLFEVDKTPTDYFYNIQFILSKLYYENIQSRSFVETLIELDLLEEITLDIKFNNGKKVIVQKMYTIDDVKLANIPDNRVAQLRAECLLAPIHAMVDSLQHIHKLVGFRNERDENNHN